MLKAMFKVQNFKTLFRKNYVVFRLTTPFPKKVCDITLGNEHNVPFGVESLGICGDRQIKKTGCDQD